MPLSVRSNHARVAVGHAVNSSRPSRKKMACYPCRRATCDKASPAAVVMLHLRSCYVSKAAILTVPVHQRRSKIEVPLEFQGLGSLGAALWRRFFPCEFDSKKERACGC